MSLNKPAAAGGDGESGWSGTPRWYLWDGGFFAIGRSEGVVPSHAHHAIQIVITVEGTVGIRGKRGDWRMGNGVVVRPDVWTHITPRVPSARCSSSIPNRWKVPTVLMVIASYYVLFAAMSDSLQTVVLESVVMTVFVIAAVVGFKSTAWIVVAGLAGHGVLDALHGNVVETASRPATKQNNASPQSIDPLFSASRPSTVFESLLWTELRPCRRVNSARRTVALAPTFLRCLSLSRGSSASGSRCAGHPSGACRCR